MATDRTATLAQALDASASRRALLRRTAGGGLAAGLALAGLRAAPASPAAPGSGGASRFRLGAFEALVVPDGFVDLPAAFFAINAPPREFAEVLAAEGIVPDAARVPINNLVVDTGRELVLVDTGYGPLAGPTAGQLLANLQAADIAPEDVGVVLLTHGHPDHIAGTVDAVGRPAFPNARYVIGRVEWDFWTSGPSLAEVPVTDEVRGAWRAAADAYLRPLRDRIELVGAETEVARGVRVLAAPGHTPGLLAVEVASGDETLLHVSDAAFQPALSLAHPDWFALPDGWPAQALQTRRTLFERAAAEGHLVMTPHFQSPGLGRVTQQGDTWAWVPAG